MGLYHFSLLVFVRSVHPRNSLQQGMIAHRFVEIHGVEHRRIKAGQQFLGDNKDLRLQIQLVEALADLPLFFGIEMKFLQQR